MFNSCSISSDFQIFTRKHLEKCSQKTPCSKRCWPGHNTGETALHLASSYDTAMALLEAKACPDITDDLGAKAFFRAGENGREDVAKAFLDAGVLASLGPRKPT